MKIFTKPTGNGLKNILGTIFFHCTSQNNPQGLQLDLLILQDFCNKTVHQTKSFSTQPAAPKFRYFTNTFSFQIEHHFNFRTQEVCKKKFFTEYLWCWCARRLLWQNPSCGWSGKRMVHIDFFIILERLSKLQWNLANWDKLIVHDYWLVKTMQWYLPGVRRQEMIRGATSCNNDVMMMTSQLRIWPKYWGGGLKPISCCQTCHVCQN